MIQSKIIALIYSTVQRSYFSYIFVMAEIFLLLFYFHSMISFVILIFPLKVIYQHHTIFLMIKWKCFLNNANCLKDTIEI